MAPRTFRLSKSRFTAGLQCHRQPWWKVHEPRAAELTPDPSLRALDRASGEWTWRMHQPANLDAKSKPRKDAVTMHGTARIEPSGNGHCRRTDTFSIEARIFAIGGLIESTIDKELQRARTKEYAFLTQWLEVTNHMNSVF